MNQKLTQRQRIMKDSKANIQEVGATIYKGTPPVYQGFKNPLTMQMEYHKVAKGIPFVKVTAWH